MVAPSDIALAFKPDGGLVGGRERGFRWVPISHDGKPLTYPVTITRKAGGDSRPHAVLAALRGAVKRVPELRARHAGVPGRGKPSSSVVS